MTVFAIYGRPTGGKEWRLRTWRDDPGHAEFSQRWFRADNYELAIVPTTVPAVRDIPRTLGGTKERT